MSYTRVEYGGCQNGFRDVVLEMFVGHVTNVCGVRDSELAKLPEGLLNAIKIKYPEVSSFFNRSIVPSISDHFCPLLECR
ncbi:PNPLA6 [Cordylochernes scorpioides]|uniref:PNPLA6 n=1 Tax=Cordylochernes scorpioides TaxID=51811 RepID=A0ABY6L455_9ARAC|nr:PNPLA6 [Cordylochernes scorpioides]